MAVAYKYLNKNNHLCIYIYTHACMSIYREIDKDMDMGFDIDINTVIGLDIDIHVNTVIRARICGNA